MNYAWIAMLFMNLSFRYLSLAWFKKLLLLYNVKLYFSQFGFHDYRISVLSDWCGKACISIVVVSFLYSIDRLNSMMITQMCGFLLLFFLLLFFVSFIFFCFLFGDYVWVKVLHIDFVHFCLLIPCLVYNCILLHYYTKPLFAKHF